MNNFNLERVIDLAAKDTEKGARVVAKVFYRILRKKGFAENQIVDIATNVLNCLVESLHGYEKKIEGEHDKRNEPPEKIEPNKIMSRWGSKQSKYRQHDYGVDKYNINL